MNIRAIIETNTYSKAMSILKKNFKSFRGSTRITFIDGDKVYKFPLIKEYSKINRQEYKNYLAYTRGESIIPVCDCEMIYTTDKTPIVIMERVQDFRNLNLTTRDLPEWVRTKNENGAHIVDSYQVGMCKDGVIRAYDHSYGA